RVTPRTDEPGHRTRPAALSVPDLHWPGPSMTVQYTLLVVLLFLSFFLVVLMIDLSLRPSVLIYADFWGLPWPPTFMNYRTALLDLIPAMWRTLWVSVVSIAGILAV